MVDLHRHDEFSTFDGFGSPLKLAEVAKAKGHTSFSVSNHGTTSGLVKHYQACKEVGIKPILGVEGYFLPTYKPQHRGYHLCLFAKNLTGYENMNRIQYEGEKQKYYNSIWTFDILEKYSEGLICTTACIASYLSQCIIKKDYKKANQFTAKMKSIFHDDFYIEIQPYKIDDEETQEKVNEVLINLGELHGVKCILTSDSHYGEKEDFDTYIKMHEIANHGSMNIEETYKERYIPTEKEIKERYVQTSTAHYLDNYMPDEEIDEAESFIKNLEEIENKIDGDILDQLKTDLPKYDKEINSQNLLKKKVVEGLKKIKRYEENRSEYNCRAQEELNVINHHGFADYFLIVADYTNYAKHVKIPVGAGRGSACNCLVSYALGITEVDPIVHGLDYHRFLRKDKKKMPDIDIDFAQSRRNEVIKYLLDKYGKQSAQVINYGLYKTKILINDLAKVCGLPTSITEVEEDEVKQNKRTIANIKNHVDAFIDEDGKLDSERLLNDQDTKEYNQLYDNICKHFSKLYKKLRYYGTHAGGVAIVGEELLKYSAIKIDSKTGKKIIAYDLTDAESINILKFDILGLKTLESLGELREITSVGLPNYDTLLNDEKVLDSFKQGNTIGVFQFESKTAQDILKTISPDSFADVASCSSLNRPGPLSLKMHKLYAENKKLNANNENNESEYKDKAYYKFLQDTHGTLIYQEQVQQIVTQLGGLSWEDADHIIKLGSGGAHGGDAVAKHKERIKQMQDQFCRSVKKHNIGKKEAVGLFEEFFHYSFNKGHATGYTLISMEEMYYKVMHNTQFWYTKLKHCHDDMQKIQFCINAVKDGTIIFIPHVNYSADYSIRKVDGENVIQQGLISIKNVGEKAADSIELERRTNGIYKSYDDFVDRCKSRSITTRVIECLKEQGALEFDKNVYLKRVVKFNSARLASKRQNY